MHGVNVVWGKGELLSLELFGILESSLQELITIPCKPDENNF